MKGGVLVLFLVLSVAGPAFGLTGTQLERWQTQSLSDLTGMSPAGAKVMLGVSDVNGVKSVAYLNDIRSLMSGIGMKRTHHIMVSIRDNATGKAINADFAEMKILDPEGKLTETTRLLTMDGSYGADISLTRAGKYCFEISATLADGGTRTFLHHFVNEG